LIVLGAFLFWSLITRLFPITVTAIILIVIYLVAQHSDVSEATTKVYAWVIAAAFAVDVFAALTKKRAA
jgi:hypothetical protein